MYLTIKEDCKFVEELDQNFIFNGKPMSRGYYNLVVSIRDFKFYKSGMKPHRGWKPTWVREYFGLPKRISVDETIESLEFLRDYLNQ
jgi:hypothetical protein